MSQAALDSVALRVQAEQIAASYFPSPYNESSALGDADTVQRLLASLSEGNYRETACRVAGISKQTFYNWLKKAETGDEGAIRLVDAVEKAEALAESDTVRNVRNASKLPQFWAAGMTWLERKSPEKWGRRPEDSSAPRVIVQVGGQASDVKVLIQSGLSPAPETSSALSPALPVPLTLGTPLGESHANTDPFAPQCLINRDSVNLSGSVPVTVNVPAEPAGGAGFAGPGQPVPGAPPRVEVSAGKARRVRGLAAKDVRARRRRAEKKTPEEAA